MIDTSHAVTQSTAVVVGGTGATGSAVLSLLQEWVGFLFGVPVNVVLAAFAGTFFGMGWREPMSVSHLIVTIVFGTMLAAILTPLVLNRFGMPPITQAATGALLGWLIQAATPWAKSNLPGILSRITDRVLGKGGDK